MPHRKVPESGKAKKLKLQAARAAKIANASANVNNDNFDDTVEGNILGRALDKPDHRKPVQRHGRRYHAMSVAERQELNELQTSKRGLESKFVRASAADVEHYKNVLSQQTFTRPLPAEAAIMQDESDHSDLTLPRRPRWRHTMTKKDVESNEEAMFKRWLAGIETKLPLQTQVADSVGHLPGFYERNLNVYRQLWRVTEASDIVLVLLDSRCPLLHFPKSLQNFLTMLKPKKSCILVLTKADLVPNEYINEWTSYFRDRYALATVSMHSYTDRPVSEQRTRDRLLPGTAIGVKNALIDAIRQAHEQLCVPPSRIMGDAEKLARWQPRVRWNIDWDALQDTDGACSSHVSKSSGATATHDNSSKSGVRTEDERALPSIQPVYLSVGLIGQPNVGKSSMLNALVGKHVVRASRTPGKTKALQTIFWTPELRLVDCPGIVFPSRRSMSQQVLSGVIPIQNVECVVHDVAQLMPLEQALHMTSAEPFSTDRLLSDCAMAKGYLTAKAGRPDVYRAGAELIRALQSSMIPWAFQPPRLKTAENCFTSSGIWLSSVASQEQFGEEDINSGDDSPAVTESDTQGNADSDSHDSGSEVDSDGAEPATLVVSMSKFGLLIVDDDTDSDISNSR